MWTWNCSARVLIKTKTISGSQLLQNTWIIKRTVVLLWKNWRKYGAVLYLFSCKLAAQNFLCLGENYSQLFGWVEPSINQLSFKTCNFLAVNTKSMVNWNMTFLLSGWLLLIFSSPSTWLFLYYFFTFMYQ